MADKKVIGIGLLALLALFASNANAGDDVGPPEPDPDPDPGIDADPWVEPPPPPPNPLLCNYVGCAELNPPGQPDYNWPYRTEFPDYRSFGLALESLGYVQNPPPASGDWSVISGAFMSVVRDFQRDFNAVRDSASGNFQAAHPALATDGLIGNRTIAAIRAAREMVATQNRSWEAIVDSAG